MRLPQDIGKAWEDVNFIGVLVPYSNINLNFFKYILICITPYNVFSLPLCGINSAAQHHEGNLARASWAGHVEWLTGPFPTLPELPAEEDEELQQQQADAQEQQQAEQPERKEAVCLRGRLSEEQSQVCPGATQHLHAPPAREERGSHFGMWDPRHGRRNPEVFR